MPDLLQAGSERPPLRVPRRSGAVLLAALAVAAAGLLSVPVVRDAGAPPEVTATTSGGSVIGGRLRVRLLLEGPASARLSALVPVLPGSAVDVGVAPAAFSPGGDAVVRLDVAPDCPAALAGLGDAALALRVDGEAVRVPVDTSGLLAETVRARCSGQGPVVPVRGPQLRAGQGGPGGALRTVVELGAPGPEVLVAAGVTAGPGLRVDVVTPLPLRIAPGRRGLLVVDLRPGRCQPDPDSPPFVLELAADGEVEPVVDAGLRGRLQALRLSAC